MTQPDPTDSKPFRVVVVGAGIVGVALSHALQLAKIDHVVLEKHSEIVSIKGSGLVIWPNGARILDQLGVLPKIFASGEAIGKEYRRWPDGSVQITGKTCAILSELFKVKPMMFDRPSFLKELYECLPDKSKVHLGRRVSQIEHTDTGVRVLLSDGSVEVGDIVVGADGVHSVVKDLMWEHASKFEPDVIPKSDKSAMISELCTFFGVSQLDSTAFAFDASESNVIQGNNMAKLLFVMQNKLCWAITFKTPHLSQELTKRRVHDEDLEALAQRFSDADFTEKIKLSDLWQTRTRQGLINTEEGVLDRWHAGRIVLVGDSAHKMTTDLGMGANIALESAVNFTNILWQELKSDPTRHFSQAELSALFQKYQDDRHKRAKAFVELSGQVTRAFSYQTAFGKFFIRYIAPLMGDKQRQQFAVELAKAPKLSYAPMQTLDSNAKGWKLADEKKTAAPWMTYVLLTSTVGVTMAYFMRERFPSLLFT